MSDPNEIVARVFRDTAVWDNHACLPMDLADNAAFLPQIERHARAGASMLSLNTGYGGMDLESHLRLLAQMRAWIAARPDRFVLIERAADIARAKRDGKLGIVFDIEGAAPLPGQDDLVDLFYALGVRWMLLAYNRSNLYAGGCHDDDHGLTAQGRALLARMRAAGMVICLSHAGPRTAREVLDAADGPVIFSHSNPRAICDHPRNISDDLIRACAASGGTIGVNGLELFLGELSVERVVRCIDHVVQLTGPAHAALGLDYVYDLESLNKEKDAMAGTFPSGLGYEKPTRCIAPEQIGEIALALAARGYDAAALSAILGGNLLRIAQRCWR